MVQVIDKKKKKKKKKIINCIIIKLMPFVASNKLKNAAYSKYGI